MSSSNRNTLHRRRSHSASSPLRQCARDKWRPPYKRARLNSACKSSQWDLSSDDTERPRDGKRSRRDSCSPVMGPRAPCLFGSSPVFRSQCAQGPSLPSPINLPCTSDAFDFFPHQRRVIQPTMPSLSSTRSGEHLNSLANLAETPAELTQLRSSAFWELQRSIAESGEGMVTRMRDWEEAHAQSPMKPEERDAHMPMLNLMKRPSFASANSDAFDEDEDEVQIIEAGRMVKSPTSLSSSFLPLPIDGAGSASDMDTDSKNDRGYLSSPGDSSPYLSSSYGSDEDSSNSLTLIRSPSSSSISLPLRPRPPISIPAQCPLDDTSVPSGASASEKAIAALTLVMANGAGSLNDYEAVRTLEEPHIASLEDPLVGEMWD